MLYYSVLNCISFEVKKSLLKNVFSNGYKKAVVWAKELLDFLYYINDSKISFWKY